MDDNRRAHKRWRQSHRVYITISDAGGDRGPFSCSTLDVSGGGLRISIAEKLNQGMRLQVRIVSRNPVKTFRLAGEVVWTKPKGSLCEAGVRFTDAASDERREWESLLGRKFGA